MRVFVKAGIASVLFAFASFSQSDGPDTPPSITLSTCVDYAKTALQGDLDQARLQKCRLQVEEFRIAMVPICELYANADPTNPFARVALGGCYEHGIVGFDGSLTKACELYASVPSAAGASRIDQCRSLGILPQPGSAATDDTAR